MLLLSCSPFVGRSSSSVTTTTMCRRPVVVVVAARRFLSSSSSLSSSSVAAAGTPRWRICERHVLHLYSAPDGGFLPALQLRAGVARDTLPPPRDVVDELPPFRRALNATLARHATRVTELAMDAAAQRSGFLPLADHRIAGALGPARHPDVDDFFGMVEARDGVLVDGSFDANPAHRLLTAKGLCVLPPEIAEVMLDGAQ